MQFHLDGFRVGDPSVQEAAPDAWAKPPDVDVLIVGCGPAGLTLAAQLSRFPEIATRIADRRPGPLRIGQADGISCRSMETFAAFGFAHRVAHEAYHVNEVAFWEPDEQGKGLKRVNRIRDVEDDLSEMPHVILNQARVHDFYLELMRNSARRLEPDYNRELVDLRREDDSDHPVVATFACRDAPGEKEIVRARYLVGCDGAHSTVRRLLGHRLLGASARQIWGVMDLLAVTDFPDIRLKCAIRSAGRGSCLIIPREGGYMVRMYIELGDLAEGERASDRNLTTEELVGRAQAILSPYKLDVREVAWWSAYEIGQRITEGFDDASGRPGSDRVPRIFLAGDACHTHSPKAGQGMNVSMADSFNLGWKLASVLRGIARPELLATYSGERRATAQELIDFDRDMARLFSARNQDAAAAAAFREYFQKHLRYTAGVETRYEPSAITSGRARQDLASGLVVGKRFHSAPVVRLADARLLHLGHVLEADGRWRLIVFAPSGDRGAAGGPTAALCDWLAGDAASPLVRHTPEGWDIDSVIDVRAVFQDGHRDLDIAAMPPLLLPAKGKLGLTDYEKIFCAESAEGTDIFDRRGINRQEGALVVVRPDHHVAHVLPIEARQELADFFAGFMHTIRLGQKAGVI